MLFHFSFIRLADYLIVNTMHVLVVNSVEVLLNYLTEQLNTTLEEKEALEEKVFSYFTVQNITVVGLCLCVCVCDFGIILLNYIVPPPPPPPCIQTLY